ncbi:MAG TPA: HNH endonuclease signature motif containing protein [Acidimicrobiales bacterium]|nr:HNH endonuclease signature motif containing protein [Acidimicrobiales bacterium]
MLRGGTDGTGGAAATLPAAAGATHPTTPASTPLPAAAVANPMLGDLALPVTTIARLLCDCRLEHHVDTADGHTVGIGTASRNIPAWLRRRVVGRDRTCRFPGCDRRIRHLHHLVHWTGPDGTHGPTDATNLVGLCWQHHHLVHEGRWSISGTPESGELTFVSPTGRTLTSRPQPPASIVDRLAALTGLPLG